MHCPFHQKNQLAHHPLLSFARQDCPHGCHKCSWFSNGSTPPSSQEEIVNPYPNGMCPPKKCCCDDKYYDNVCEYFVHIVEDYEEQVSNKVEPPPTRPTRDRLIGIATEAYWLEKARHLNIPAANFDLDWPMPVCFQRMVGNIDIILADFEELEIEHYGRSSALVEVKIEPTEVTIDPPAKKMRQSTLAEALFRPPGI
jgi:hypothetical protein